MYLSSIYHHVKVVYKGLEQGIWSANSVLKAKIFKKDGSIAVNRSDQPDQTAIELALI